MSPGRPERLRALPPNVYGPLQRLIRPRDLTILTSVHDTHFKGLICRRNYVDVGGRELRHGGNFSKRKVSFVLWPTIQLCKSLRFLSEFATIAIRIVYWPFLASISVGFKTANSTCTEPSAFKDSVTSVEGNPSLLPRTPRFHGRNVNSNLTFGAGARAFWVFRRSSCTLANFFCNASVVTCGCRSLISVTASKTSTTSRALLSD